LIISVLKTGIVSKAKGSAYIEQGQTKAICAVYGPREIPRRSDFSMRGILNCTFERTPFATSKRRGPGPQSHAQDEEEMSSAIGQALEATVCMVYTHHAEGLVNQQCAQKFRKHQIEPSSTNFFQNVIQIHKMRLKNGQKKIFELFRLFSRFSGRGTHPRQY
jgi:hypothetical protein